MKKIVWISLTFLVLIVIPCATFLVLHGCFTRALWPLILSGFLFIVIALLVIESAIARVPENEVWLTEVWGKYERRLSPGLHFCLPFIEKPSRSIFLGKRILELSLKEDGGLGDVDLQNFSIGVTACFYYRIVDPYTAVYNVSNFAVEMAKKVESTLRDYLAIYSLDEAINFKGQFTKEIIACRVNLASGSTPDISDDDYKKSKFYKSLSDIGVEPESLDIVDFSLPDSIIEERKRSLVASEEKEAAEINLGKAKIEGRTLIAQATAKKQAKILESQGEAFSIKSILEASGIKNGQSARYLINLKKWEAVAKSQSSDKVIIVDSGNDSKVGDGVKFGVGSGAAGRRQPQQSQKM